MSSQHDCNGPFQFTDVKKKNIANTHKHSETADHQSNRFLRRRAITGQVQVLTHSSTMPMINEHTLGNVDVGRSPKLFTP